MTTLTPKEERVWAIPLGPSYVEIRAGRVAPKKHVTVAYVDEEDFEIKNIVYIGGTLLGSCTLQGYQTFAHRLGLANYHPPRLSSRLLRVAPSDAKQFFDNLA